MRYRPNPFFKQKRYQIVAFIICCCFFVMGGFFILSGNNPLKPEKEQALYSEQAIKQDAIRFIKNDFSDGAKAGSIDSDLIAQDAEHLKKYMNIRQEIKAHSVNADLRLVHFKVNAIEIHEENGDMLDVLWMPWKKIRFRAMMRWTNGAAIFIALSLNKEMENGLLPKQLLTILPELLSGAILFVTKKLSKIMI